MSAFEYLFGLRKDKHGRILSFTRFDVALSVVLGLTLLAAISYSAEPHNGWTTLRSIVVLGVFVSATLLAQHRQVVFGCALGIVTMRLAIGVFSASHSLFFLVTTVVCAATTWVLLKGAS